MTYLDITDVNDMHRWGGAILASKLALRNGYAGTYKAASEILHEIARKYEKPTKSLLEILLGI